VRFEIFRDRNFTTGVMFMAFIGVALFGTMALVSPFMQNVMGYPITTAGWLLGTRGIGTLVSMAVVGRMLRFIEARWLLLAGLIMMAGTIYEMELYTDQTPGWILIVMNIQGFGLGLLFVPLSTVAFLTLGSELRTDGTAMLTLIRNIFSSIGISIMVAQLTSGTTVMHARLTEYVTPFNSPLQMPDAASIFNMTTDAGRALLDGIITQQAVIIAYGNDYKMLLLLSIFAMPLVLFVGSSAAVRQLAAKPEAHAAMD
jgi:DHA2 family multidrug resistance protein